MYLMTVSKNGFGLGYIWSFSAKVRLHGRDTIGT
jgi:hypothetical protein